MAGQKGRGQGRKWRKAQGLRTLYHPTPLPGGPRFHFSEGGQSHKSLFYKHLKGLACDVRYGYTVGMLIFLVSFTAAPAGAERFVMAEDGRGEMDLSAGTGSYRLHVQTGDKVDFFVQNEFLRKKLSELFLMLDEIDFEPHGAGHGTIADIFVNVYFAPGQGANGMCLKQYREVYFTLRGVEGWTEETLIPVSFITAVEGQNKDYTMFAQPDYTGPRD